MAGLTNYKYGNKNNWRRWQWNRIVEKLKISPSDAKVLYLVGDNDCDRGIAKQHGFKDCNLIAVDLDEKNITKVKKAKLNGISCDLSDLIMFWQEPKIDIIVADFCCGFNENIIDKFTQAVLYSKGLRINTILAVNLLRGRETFKNAKIKKFFYKNKNDNKHRGEFFLNWMFLLQEKIFFYGNAGKVKIDRDDWDFLMQPKYNSYKSINNLIFDSVVSYRGFFGILDKENRIYNNYNENIKKQITALKAIRTMRIEGTL